MNVQRLLYDGGIAFQVLHHNATYDAQRLAHAVAVRGDMVAKTVLLRADNAMVLAVLPATHLINLREVEIAIGAASVELASEPEFNEWFPDCELGALPPFGSQYGMETLVDESLATDDEIVFEGNSHEEAIRMKFSDFASLEKPVVASFAYHG